MTPEELAKVGAKLPLSRSTLARNPGLALPEAPAAIITPGKRFRQDAKPLLNKLETAFGNVLAIQHPNEKIHAQAVKFRLANGHLYTPDFFSFPQLTAWEVKGPHAFKGAFEVLKLAASIYQEITWILVWKEDGNWKFQKALP